MNFQSRACRFRICTGAMLFSLCTLPRKLFPQLEGSAAAYPPAAIYVHKAIAALFLNLRFVFASSRFTCSCMAARLTSTT